MNGAASLSVPKGTPLLAARGIARADPLSGAELLHPTSLDLYCGDHLVISGPSGAGKSVLLRSLALLDPLSAGSVLLRGAPVVAAAIPAYRSQVCYLRQRPAVMIGTVEDALRVPFGLRVHAGRAYARERVLGMLALAGKPEAFLGKQARDLSGGEAQTVALIRTLQLDPAVLLLDEPTAALDPEATEVIEAMVLAWARGAAGSAAAPAAATIWITHSPAQEARVGNRHYRMHAGTLSEAPAQETTATAAQAPS
jgi:putative ABC transport system ATP-binding protein